MPSEDCLDHAVINVKYEMDKAAALFEKLGFSLTPRGYHSHGSINHLMIFGDDYLELIGIPEKKEIERRDLIHAPIGINGIVFKANDIEDIQSRLEIADFHGDPPRAFSRPVEIDGENKEAKFWTTTVRPEIFPGGRVYYCEHNTPELVWRQEWQAHANGVTSILELVVVTYNSDHEAGHFATLLNAEVKINDAGSRCVPLNGSQVTVLSPEQYAIRYEDLALPMGDRCSIFGSIVFATNKLNALNGALSNSNGIATIQSSERTIAQLGDYNTILEFISPDFS